MRIFMDCEFICDGRFILPLSWGGVREDGARLYLENRSALGNLYKANEFVVENVLPHMIMTGDTFGVDQGSLEDWSKHVVHQAQMADEIRDFAGERPEFWSWYGAHDWVMTTQLFGDFDELPEGWPMYCRDLQQEADRLGIDLEAAVPVVGTAHRAIDDAARHYKMYEHLALADSSLGLGPA